MLAEQDAILEPGGEPENLDLSQAISPDLYRNGIEIDLICGFGDFGIDVPDTLKRGILMLVAHWYEFRGAVPPSQQPVSLPPGFDSLMAPYRRVNL